MGLSDDFWLLLSLANLLPCSLDVASGVLRPIFAGRGGGRSLLSSSFEKRLKKHIVTLVVL
jgi:hypothetical protein